MPPRIEQTKLRHDPLKEGFIGKAPAIFVHHNRMWAAQFDDSGMDAGRRPARDLRRNGVGQHYPQAVLDLVQDATDLRTEDEAVAGQRCRRQA